MDVSALSFLDPAVWDPAVWGPVRDSVATVVHALAPAFDPATHAPAVHAHAAYGHVMHPALTVPDAGFADPDLGGVEPAQAKPPDSPPDKPADPPVGEKPSTTPPERKVGDAPLEQKNVPGTGAPPAAAVDFSIWAIIMRADLIGKAVIALLAMASIWSWAIIFEKWIALRSVNARSDKFEDRFWSGGSVDSLYEDVSRRPNSPMASLFAAAMREWRQSTASDHTGAQTILGGVKERIERVMNVTLGREMSRLERHVSFLATVGATAPFIGLFGTVWGIMNAFQGIAIQKNTNLATVAPGISEALFATALGLLAAIPAVIAYNRFSTELDRYAHRLEAFTGEFTAIVSRQLETGAR